MEALWLAIVNGITLALVTVIGLLVNKQLAECKRSLKYLRSDIRSLRKQLAAKGKRPHS